MSDIDNGGSNPLGRLARKLGSNFDSPRSSLKDLLALGIVDEPVEVREDYEGGDAHRTGYLARVGTIALDDLDRALRLISSGCGSETDVKNVNPRFVMAQAWHPDRLRDAQARVASGLENDPIRLTGYRYPGLPEFFGVTDGMHRTVAARLAGKESINAEVMGHWDCNPAQYTIRGRSVVHKERTESQWRHEETDAVLDLVRRLGVDDDKPGLGRLLRPLRRPFLGHGGE